jgi:branched-chain amino acid transport system ATP-binding protein
MIRVESLHKRFGGLRALDGASLEIAAGSITGLIGPNGAGKTTLFNIIAGAFKPTSGRVYLDGNDITGLKPHELFHKGVLRTFQIAHEFTTLTVTENLMMVPGEQRGEGLLDAWFRPGLVRVQEATIRAKAEEVLEFLGLTHLAQEPAAKIVFLDEVGAGVNRTLLRTIGDAIQRLNKERGYTFCMIEHDIDFISRLCDPVIVMAEGTVLMEGSAEAVKSDSRVIEAYLGTGLKNRPKTAP